MIDKITHEAINFPQSGQLIECFERNATWISKPAAKASSKPFAHQLVTNAATMPATIPP